MTKNKFSSSTSNQKFNLQQHLAQAVKSNDHEKIQLIKRLENEIEKLLLIQEIRKNENLLKVFKNDVLKVEQDGSYHLIEMILLKEIEMLNSGDYEAICMLEKLKKNAQNKLLELTKLAQKIHENQIKQNQQDFSNKLNQAEAPRPQYKPLISFEGFHHEKTLGGEFIQVLDADIKNLVTSDIVNSKPSDLSKAILDEIRNIKLSANEIINSENSPSSEKAEDITNKKNFTILKNPQSRDNSGEWAKFVSKHGALSKDALQNEKV